MNRWSALALLTALAGALALRVPHLDRRPLHNDEAVNAFKSAELWQQGRYAYDPEEYHGPTLHYATVPFFRLSGARNADELADATLRLAPVVFGIGLILLLPLLADGLGRPAAAWAGLFTAVSPAMVFYSRYFIHEMLLVFFTGLTLGAGWRYARARSPGWAALAGAGVGLMFATKETFVLALAAMGLSAAAVVMGSAPRGTGLRALASNWNGRHAAIALSAVFLVWLLFFSSFFTHFAGLADSVRTYLPWLKRAGGESPHRHPWYFYLERLAWFHPARGPVWSEGAIVALAVVGAAVSMAPGRPRLQRFLALYTILLTGIYSAISYKTPWCLLSFFHGMILLAGVGAAALVEWARSRPARTVAAGLILGLAAQLSRQAWRSSFVYVADRRNPYVYAQTVPDLMNLVQRTEGLARVAPGGRDTIVKVIAPDNDYWPLPWYLRRFKHTGWYDRPPDDPFASIVVVASKLDARLDERSDHKWVMVGLTEFRPGKFFEQYVELGLWTRYVEARRAAAE